DRFDRSFRFHGAVCITPRHFVKFLMQSAAFRSRQMMRDVLHRASVARQRDSRSTRHAHDDRAESYPASTIKKKRASLITYRHSDARYL
ncbi:hypothetical protein, partial [Klebsiella michiganensis]|uniref:hypothetical protein n=1 Tax=Klebsiella michiganensis TaxID=1134687 RepID=UPI001953F9AF